MNVLVSGSAHPSHHLLVGDDGTALADGFFRADGGVSAGLPFQLGVEFGADADHVGGDVEPHQEHDDRTQRAEGLVVAAEVADVEGEADRGEEPGEGRGDGADADPLHFCRGPAGRVAIEDRRSLGGLSPRYLAILTAAEDGRIPTIQLC